MNGFLEGMLLGTPIGCCIYRYGRSMSFLSLRIRMAERNFANIVIHFGKIQNKQAIPYCTNEPDETKNLECVLDEELHVWESKDEPKTLACIKLDPSFDIVLIVISEKNCFVKRELPHTLGTRRDEEHYLKTLIRIKKKILHTKQKATS